MPGVRLTAGADLRLPAGALRIKVGADGTVSADPLVPQLRTDMWPQWLLEAVGAAQIARDSAAEVARLAALSDRDEEALDLALGSSLQNEAEVFLSTGTNPITGTYSLAVSQLCWGGAIYGLGASAGILSMLLFTKAKNKGFLTMSEEAQYYYGGKKIIRQVMGFMMFVIEIIAGWLANSAGLIADGADMFADAAVYGVALLAVGKSALHQRNAARLAGILQLLLGVAALLEAGRRAWAGSFPEEMTMLGISLLALAANIACLWLVSRHRHGGVHMRASYIFSANDVLANLGVIAAAGLVLVSAVSASAASSNQIKERQYRQADRIEDGRRSGLAITPAGERKLEIIRRELDLVWTKATDNSVFSEEQLELISSMLVEEPVEKKFLTVMTEDDDVDGEIQEKYALKIYRPLIRDKRYLVGVDTSGGTGKDSSAFTVVDPIDLKPCAVFRNNKINTAYYCSVLLQLVTDVLPNSILVIERNSYGGLAVTKLL